LDYQYQQISPGDYHQPGPGRAFYALGIVILIAGIGFFVMFLFTGIVGLAGRTTRVVVPGEKELVLSEPGKYTVFHEYKSVIDGKVYASSPQLADLDITLRDQASEEKVKLSPTAVSSTYNIGGRSGYGVFDFRIDRPGTYLLSANYLEDRPGPETVLAVSHGFVTDLVKLIFASIGILFGTLAVSILIIVITLVKRRNAIDRQKKWGPYPNIV
jgi:hypothetical protein